jgi:cobalt/nickel transport system permease protein
MIHTIAGIDQRANAGDTVWHRASALSKLLLAAGLIGVAVFAPSLRLLIALHALAWVLAITSRVPLRLLGLAAGYPLVIAGLFVLAAWDGTWQTPLRIVLRPLTASLTAVWLVGTTPYPDLFAPLSRVLPRAAADGLFLTYRALFELISRTDRLWRALQVRGGNAVPARQRLQLAGQGLGTLVLHGFERSQRLYATMLLRGHSGRICGCRHYAELTRADLVVAAAGAVVIAVSIAGWRTP